ncbi:MAG TPA: hypothetical protein VLL98_00595 [Rickettsiales bacterium]|nr:hypothetical protein [Rickettsiales bacterium]
MKLHNLFFVLSLCLVPLFNANAKVRLATPEDLEIEQLNKDEKDRLKNINYSETVGMPNQYKGKLKYTEGVEEVRLKDVRIYIGVGGRATFARDEILKPKESEYTNTNLNFNSDFNYFGSIGLYWRNGIRTEFEYSATAIDGDATDTSGFYTYNEDDSTYTYSDKVKFDLKIDTYMLNLILEKTQAKTAIKPYVGFGIGMASANFEGLVSNSRAYAPAAQFMIGLSYPISDGIVAFYLGYRGFFTAKMEQEFSKIQYTSGTYSTVQVKEDYYYQTHNVDFGIKFFF